MKRPLLIAVIIFLLITIQNIHAQIISTIAGNGSAGYNGDNIAATIASLYKPSGVVVDNQGNVLIADFLNNRIRKVNTGGFISTIAGNGGQGYNGDNIAATSAAFFSPTTFTVTSTGALYIADGNNNRIRKVNESGIVTTIAGNGTAGYNGDNILATNALVNYPSDGIVVDGAGNVYFADTYNHRIRKINTSGIISTVAGTGTPGYNGDNILASTARLNYPDGLAIDAFGNLYIGDATNNRVRKVDTNGMITTIAGTGIGGYNGDNIPAVSATLYAPVGVAVDKYGSVFIAEASNNRIRKVNAAGIITTVAGTGNTTYNGDNIAAILANINYPNGIAIDSSGNLIIADLGNHRIRKITNASILPVTLLAFTAQQFGGTTLLQWKTTKEVNLQQFKVEVGQNGISFLTLGVVQANNLTGTFNYSFTDADPSVAGNYYRIKMVDKDGRFTYSNTVYLKPVIAATQLKVYPNPASSLITFSFGAIEKENYTIQISDVQGKVLQQITSVGILGQNKVDLDIHAYVHGTYILSLYNKQSFQGSLTFKK